MKEEVKPVAAAVVPQSKGKKNAYSNSVQKMTCPFCPRVFPWASSLQRHMLTHTGKTQPPKHADINTQAFCPGQKLLAKGLILLSK